MKDMNQNELKPGMLAQVTLQNAFINGRISEVHEGGTLLGVPDAKGQPQMQIGFVKIVCEVIVQVDPRQTPRIAPIISLLEPAVKPSILDSSAGVQ